MSAPARTKSVPRPSVGHVLERTAERGWFRQQLWAIEGLLWGRWPYWLAMGLNRTVGKLPEWKIPQVPFAAPRGCNQKPGPYVEPITDEMREAVGTPHAALSHVLGVFERCRRYTHDLIGLVQWWNWAFGGSVRERPRVPDEVEVILYHELQLHRLIGNPADWGAEITSEWYGGGKGGTAWFPTPLSIVTCMTEMNFGIHGGDTRLLTANDPCVGTGAFLLGASNYSLRLSCCDIDPLMCAWTEFAGWLFIPWLVYPQYIREFHQPSVAAAEPISAAETPVNPEPAKRNRRSRRAEPSLFEEVPA